MTGRQEHVAVLTVHPAEGLLLVRILVRHVVWQKTAKESKVRVRGFFFFFIHCERRNWPSCLALTASGCDCTLRERSWSLDTGPVPSGGENARSFFKWRQWRICCCVFFLENVNARGVWSRLGCLTSASMWVKLLLLLRVDEAVASRIWVRISLWSTSCVSGWVSTAIRAQVK